MLAAEFVSVKSDEQIAEQIKVIDYDNRDPFGWGSEALLPFLTWQGLSTLTWQGLSTWRSQYRSPDSLGEHAAWYLEFALGKARGHRGLSAQRSVLKLRQLAWLGGRQDVVDAMDGRGYAMYGVPKLLVFWEMLRLGVAWPDPDDVVIGRMARGEPCEPHCLGCGK